MLCQHTLQNKVNLILQVKYLYAKFILDIKQCSQFQLNYKLVKSFLSNQTKHITLSH